VKFIDYSQTHNDCIFYGVQRTEEKNKEIMTSQLQEKPRSLSSLAELGKDKYNNQPVDDQGKSRANMRAVAKHCTGLALH